MEKKPSLEQLKATAKELEDMIMDGKDVLPPDEHGVFKKLNYKEMLFVNAYIKGSDIHEATKRAGYANPNHGYTLVKQDNVARELERREYAINAVGLISKDSVQSELLSLIAESRSDARQDRATILRALDMIAKMNGFYTPDTNIQINNQLNKIVIEIVKPNGTIDIESTDA